MNMKMNMIFIKTVKHFFPDFNYWLKELNDPRNKNGSDYQIESLLWIGLLLFLLKLGARRQINYEFNTEKFIRNLCILTNAEIEKIPYDGTLAYLLKHLDPYELFKLRTKMVNRLIRMKTLINFRLLGYYRIAFDGTGYLGFKEKHCEHCLTKKKNGKIVYWYHPVLEAKLVIENGIVISIGTEFIENPDAGFSKQDCELKAFRRLAEMLKRDFPQLRICLLLDALYANQNAFDICKKNNWKYIITFKEGSMPETYQEYINLKPLNADCRAQKRLKEIRQNYQWVKEISYKDHLLNVLECEETKINETKRFVWVTNFDIDNSNFHLIANKGGRLRWKIENEGFNTQKNGGYNMEHAFSENENAMKNFYILLQLAHIINQLIEKGSLFKTEVKKLFGSIRNIARRLLESLRTSLFDSNEINSISSQRYQIRLRGS